MAKRKESDPSSTATHGVAVCFEGRLESRAGVLRTEVSEENLGAGRISCTSPLPLSFRFHELRVLVAHSFCHCLNWSGIILQFIQALNPKPTTPASNAFAMYVSADTAGPRFAKPCPETIQCFGASDNKLARSCSRKKSQVQLQTRPILPKQVSTKVLSSVHHSREPEQQPTSRRAILVSKESITPRV